MFGAAIKKAFFDLWDHLLLAMGLNLVYTLATVGVATLLSFVSGGGLALQVILGPVPFLLAAVLGGVATFAAKDLVFAGRFEAGALVGHLKASWKASLAFGAAWLLIGAGFLFGIPFYTQLHPWAGFAFGIVLAWIAFFGAGMSLFYPGLLAQVESNLTKLLKKSFLVFLANPWTSLAMAGVFLVGAALTGLTFGFFPGIVGLSIWLQVCFKFLMAKYEWIEKNPDADPKVVPWSQLLAEDLDRVGPRSLKSLIFPWKD